MHQPRHHTNIVLANGPGNRHQAIHRGKGIVLELILREIRVEGQLNRVEEILGEAVSMEKEEGKRECGGNLGGSTGIGFLLLLEELGDSEGGGSGGGVVGGGKGRGLLERREGIGRKEFLLLGNGLSPLLLVGGTLNSVRKVGPLLPHSNIKQLQEIISVGGAQSLAEISLLLQRSDGSMGATIRETMKRAKRESQPLQTIESPLASFGVGGLHISMDMELERGGVFHLEQDGDGLRDISTSGKTATKLESRHTQAEQASSIPASQPLLLMAKGMSSNFQQNRKKKKKKNLDNTVDSLGVIRNGGQNSKENVIISGVRIFFLIQDNTQGLDTFGQPLFHERKQSVFVQNIVGIGGPTNKGTHKDTGVICRGNEKENL